MYCKVSYQDHPYSIISIPLKQQSAKTIRTHIQIESDIPLNESV